MKIALHMWNIPNYRRNVNSVSVGKTKMINFQYPIVNLEYVPWRELCVDPSRSLRPHQLWINRRGHRGHETLPYHKRSENLPEEHVIKREYMSVSNKTNPGSTSRDPLSSLRHGIQLCMLGEQPTQIVNNKLINQTRKTDRNKTNP